MADQTPITDEWLAEVDFKWRQEKRQPNKHWNLACNIESRGVLEQTTIEVQRNGWKNRKGDYIGDPSSWMLWITDTFQRTVFIRNIRWQEEITLLAEVITGRPWKPENHIYGQAWPDGSNALRDRLPTPTNRGAMSPEGEI